MKKRKGSNRKVVLVLVILAIFIFALSYFILNTRGSLNSTDISSVKRKVTYPTQYSDSHITVNAQVSDPKFKDSVIFGDNLLANVISAIPKSQKPEVVERKESGTWLWTPILEITPKYMDFIISGAKKNGVKNIYLSIDSYLDIYIMPKSPEKDKKKKDFDNTIETFITEAHKNGLTVDAEGGWRNWAEKGNQYKAFAVLDYTIDFNKNHKKTFSGDKSFGGIATHYINALMELQ